MQAVALCEDIKDESLDDAKSAVQLSIAEMEQDRRIVLIGASRSGKSTLLGGMVGCPVLAGAALPHHYVRWRYMNAESTPAEHCRFLPEPGLFGLELVDTRGCEEPAVAEAVAPLLPGADVVVVVVDARELNSSPVWGLMAPLPEESGPACLLALTYADTLDAAQTVTLSETVRGICREKLGRVLPVYQINPTQTARAGEFGDKVIEAIKSSSGGLRAAIRRVLKCGSDLLYKQGSILKARDAVTRTDNGFLQGVEQEIDNFQARQMQGVRNCVLNYAASAQRCMPRLLHHLRRSLGWFLSPVVLIRLEHYATAAENLYYRLVLDDVSIQQEELDKQFVLSCNAHWRSVRPRMKQALHCEIGDFPAEALETELATLRQRLQSSLYEPFRSLQIRSHFSALFRCQVDWMRFFVSCVCLCLVIAGVLGYCGLHSLALVFLAVTGGFWLFGSLLHALVVRRICQLVRKEAEPLHESLSGIMSELVQDMIVSRVSAYRRLYTEPRQQVARNETMLAPLQQRQSEIFRQLRSSVPHV